MKIPVLYDIERCFRRLKLYIKDRINPIRKKQQYLFNQNFKDTKKMIVFVNFPNNEFCGGIMTIFYYAKISRQMKEIHGCEVLHANLFNHEAKYYISQDNFKNDETIYNMELVMQKAKDLDKLILHVPEMLMADMAKELKKYKNVLKKIPDFQINVLNQNVDVFSPREEWQSLFEITKNITQTTGFDKYSTQEVCDKWGIPVYPMPAYHDNVSPYTCEITKFEQKEKIIVYSLDEQPLKEAIISNLKNNFPDFKLKEIKGLKYMEYLDLIQNAMFSITFGEGYDGYFIEPVVLGGLGFSVFNERFFPSPNFKEFPVVFESYEELNNKIVDAIHFYMNNPFEYDNLSFNIREEIKKYNYKPERTIEGMKKLYLHKPEFIPNKKEN